MISAWTFGILPDGRKVTAYRVHDASGLTAIILDYGLILQSLILPDGRNITLNHADLDSYLSGNDYRGAIIGPYANRIEGACFNIEGTVYALAANEKSCNLHSGPNGFDRKLWKITPSKDKLEAVLKTQSMSGFPGQLEVQVRFALSQQRLRLSLRAVSDQSTPINMTYHPYWNLKGKGKIDDHDLHLISAGQTAYTLTDIKDISQTRFDFTMSRPIGQVQIDHNFKHTQGVVLNYGQTSLHISSSLPDLQIYTGDQMKTPRSGIAVEPQFQPNDINLERKSLFKANDAYDHWIEYKFDWR